MATKALPPRPAASAAAERTAMKERAAELRAEGKKGAKTAEGLEALLAAIEKMEPEDRALAERIHATVTSTAPQLLPKTWYGMPAYTNDDGKVMFCFKNAASSTSGTQPWSFRMRPTSTTETFGRSRSRCTSGPPPYRRRSSSW